MKLLALRIALTPLAIIVPVGIGLSFALAWPFYFVRDVWTDEDPRRTFRAFGARL